MRKINIQGREYKYKIGKGDIVIITPSNKKHITNQSIVSGISWENLERGYWKGWFKGVTPSMIKQYIIDNNVW